MTIEEEEPKPVVVASEEAKGVRFEDVELEPAGEELEQVNVQAQVKAADSVEEPVGTPGVSEATGADMEPVKRRSWFRRLFGV